MKIETRMLENDVNNVKMCFFLSIWYWCSTAGEVILSQEPYVCVSTHKRCDGCFRTTNLSKCSRCQVVWYCGTPCQVMDSTLCHESWCYKYLNDKDIDMACCCGSCDDIQKSEWRLHRLECEALSRLDDRKRKSVTPSIRLMLKLYLRRKLQDEKVNVKKV